jgi:multicomponent Na+:H+ antiporter subunit C
LTTEEEVSDDPEDARVSRMSGEEATALDEARPQPEAARDTELPDELDALPGLEGSR